MIKFLIKKPHVSTQKQKKTLKLPNKPTSKIPTVKKKLSKYFIKNLITHVNLFNIVRNLNIKKTFIFNKLVQPNSQENLKRNKLEKVCIIKSNMSIIL